MIDLFYGDFGDKHSVACNSKVLQAILNISESLDYEEVYTDKYNPYLMGADPDSDPVKICHLEKWQKSIIRDILSVGYYLATAKDLKVLTHSESWDEAEKNGEMFGVDMETGRIYYIDEESWSNRTPFYKWIDSGWNIIY